MRRTCNAAPGHCVRGGRQPAEPPGDLEARVLIGSPYVREAEDCLASAGMLAGAALPILVE